jgi:tRNA A-37 threonylcarbamoyl transferase component Bud32
VVASLSGQSGFRVERLAPGEHCRVWGAALTAFDPAAAVVLKRDAGTTVYRASILGRELVLKCWELRTPGSRVKAAFRASRAHRHWLGAHQLEALGVRTAHCYSLVTETRTGRHPRQWLVMELLPGKTVLQHMADRDLSVVQEHRLARALGRQVERIARGRYLNRDHKPSNLIVIDIGGQEAETEVAVIDTVGIRKRRGLSKPGERVWRMLHALVVEPIGVGIPPRRGLCMRVICEVLAAWQERFPDREQDIHSTHSGGRWILWNNVRASLQRHGDPTPRVDPLASPVASSPKLDPDARNAPSKPSA